MSHGREEKEITDSKRRFFIKLTLRPCLLQIREALRNLVNACTNRMWQLDFNKPQYSQVKLKDVLRSNNEDSVYCEPIVAERMTCVSPIDVNTERFAGS